MKYNLHTHSYYCGHGEGELIEYVRYAELKGFELLGFSEHCPFPNNLFHKTRMDYSKLNIYLSDIDNFRKFSKIPLLKGFECDYVPEFREYFEEIKTKVDYLITGTHFIVTSKRIASPFSSALTKEEMRLYTSQIIKTMETGLFTFVAHPDLFLCHQNFTDDNRAMSKAIIEAAIDLNLPIEVNGNGLGKLIEGVNRRGYPNKEFWTLAKELGAKCIANSDAHKVENLDKYYKELMDFCNELELDMVTPYIVEENGKRSIIFK